MIIFQAKIYNVKKYLVQWRHITQFLVGFNKNNKKDQFYYNWYAEFTYLNIWFFIWILYYLFLYHPVEVVTYMS